MKSFKDIYKFPFISHDLLHSWIYDSDGNFIFQFEIPSIDKNGVHLWAIFLSIINSHVKSDLPKGFYHENGYIISPKGVKIILIRGWGNLTGIGGHNLPPDEAMNIQDTLAQYIVDKLNGEN